MKPFKTIRRVVLALVLLLVIGLVVVFFSIDRILRSTVESQATQSLNLKTTLNGASLSLLGGKLKLSDLEIASPPGYSAPQMLSLGEGSVAVSYGQLRSNPVHVSGITLDKPRLVIENQGGTLNFKKAADNMPKGDQPAQPAPSGESKPPMKLIIDDLTVKDAVVIIRPGIPGLPPEMTVPIATFSMKNVGTGDGSQNGAALKDVVMQVITAMAGHASSSGSIPGPLQAILKGNMADTLAQLGGDAQKRVLQALPQGLGQTLSNPQSLLNGGNSPGGAPAVPALPGNLDPGKAVQGIGGMLGGKKDGH